MIAFKYGKQEQNKTCNNCRYADNSGYLVVCTEPIHIGDHKVIMSMGNSCLKWEKK